MTRLRDINQIMFIRNTMYTTLFKLVHTALWGPSHAPSSNGYSYYIVFIDEISSYTWIYLLKHKSGALSEFKLVQNYVSTQFNSKIKPIQSYFLGELRTFTKLLDEQGIVHSLTCPYTPHHNGVVERKHIKIVDMELTMLSHAFMPISIWYYSFTTVVYLINLLLTNFLYDYNSPFQVLFKGKHE